LNLFSIFKAYTERERKRERERERERKRERKRDNTYTVAKI